MKQEFYLSFMNRIILFFIVLVASFNCYAQVKFPLTSDYAADYYIKDPNFFEFYIHPKLQLNTVNFNEQEASIPIKGEYFTPNTVSTKIRYLEIASFDREGYHYKLIIYNNFDAPNDGFLLKTQLNSYNSDGRLVDALMLDSRYADEEAELWKDFIIEETGAVLINENISRSVAFDDVGTEHELEPALQGTYAKAKYIIENGEFKLISQENLIEIN